MIQFATKGLTSVTKKTLYILKTSSLLPLAPKGESAIHQRIGNSPFRESEGVRRGNDVFS